MPNTEVPKDDPMVDCPSDGSEFRIAPELSSIENVHGIEVLLYVFRNEGCTRTDVYDGLVRSISVQSRIDELSYAGLIDIRREQGTRSNYLYLTDAGYTLATVLMDFNIRMRRMGA